MSHPLRRRILRAYLDGDLDRTSASELARGMGEPVGKVAYHLKVLARCDILCLEPGQGEQGAGELRYGWVTGVESNWLGLVLDFLAQSDSAG